LSLSLGASLAVGLFAPGCGAGDSGSAFQRGADAGKDIDTTPFPTLEAGVPGLAACATATARAQKVPVYMLFVVDGSGSMDNDNKWAALVPALDAIFDDFQTRADSAFGVGMTIFADKNDPTIGDTTAGPYNKMDVPIAFVDQAQHDKLRARVDGTQPNLGTPTYEVLSGQFPLLESFAPAAPLASDGKRVLVMMTDGVPDPDMPAGQNEGPWSLKLVGDEFAKTPPAGPITTFAVGIGALSGQADYNPTFMGQLAMAGGAPNRPCDPNEATNPSNMCHFQITPGGQTVAQLEQAFIDTINKIRTRVLSCDFKLQSAGGTLDPAKVNVVYTNGQGVQTLVPKDTSDGWTYDDDQHPTLVTLHGAVCDQVKADAQAKVDVVIGCLTVIR
jgi:hypothetical protein